MWYEEIDMILCIEEMYFMPFYVPLKIEENIFHIKVKIYKIIKADL